MSGSQFHNVGDVCTAMKQFTRQTSQSSSKGSFATQDMLTTFSEAFTSMCEEVQRLRAEVDDMKTQLMKISNNDSGSTPAPPRAAKKGGKKRSPR